MDFRMRSIRKPFAANGSERHGSVSAPPLKTSIDKFFNAANAKNMRDVVTDFYAADADFVDPMVHIKGREKLISYYSRLYENVVSIRFDIHHEIFQGKETCALWTMRLCHKRFNGGREMLLDGTSWVRADANGQAIWHRDSFDLTAMLHDNIPVVGMITRFVRKVAKGAH